LAALAPAAALALAACTKPFVRPAPEELRLGETLRAELVARMGPPAAQGSMQRNGKDIAVLSYTFRSDSEKPHGYDGVIPDRGLIVFFHEERLVGYEFNSTVEVDHTDFSARKMRSIVKGRTTRAEVAELLGRPSGYLAFPMVQTPTRGEAMLYAYRESRRVPFGAPMVFSKALVISFDKNGTVDDLVYTTSGTP
jgi:outer membrane protein assembly factor BamE (lipoprotein component of BamABCDE complex)